MSSTCAAVASGDRTNYTSNPTIADRVTVERGYQVYRDAGAVVTRRGDARQEAKEVATFLASPDGARIFGKWGWIVPGVAK